MRKTYYAETYSTIWYNLRSSCTSTIYLQFFPFSYDTINIPFFMLTCIYTYHITNLVLISSISIYNLHHSKSLQINYSFCVRALLMSIKCTIIFVADNIFTLALINGKCAVKVVKGYLMSRNIYMHLHVKWQKTQVFIFHNISQATLLEECLDKNFLHIPKNVSATFVFLLQTFLFNFFCPNTANKNLAVSQTKYLLRLGIDSNKCLIVQCKL